MGADNATLAAVAIGTAQQLGVNRFVVCAGARNAPLVAHLAGDRKARVWTHFDERSAAFFALGMARRSEQPVAVVTTSGTAVAELFPAVIEAHYSDLPLVLLTADRPPSFRGSGAPQAIEQPGIFGEYAGASIDLTECGLDDGHLSWNRRSPLHLNICFDEPRRESLPGKAAPLAISIDPPLPALAPSPIVPFVRPVVILGDLGESERDPVIEFLSTSGIPFWAEATSGLREHPGLLPRRINDERQISDWNPAEVIRIGGVPSLRFWRDLETLPDTAVLNFSKRRFTGLARTENVNHFPLQALTGLTSYVTESCEIPDLPVSQRDIFAILDRHPGSEPSIVRRLSKLIPPESQVFLGNSLPIREWNLAATTEIPHPHCQANRGANGIDGEVSSFLGQCVGYSEGWGVFGDLTSLYDLNALYLTDQLQETTIRIVILNNRGGQIFSRLPSMQGLDDWVLNRHRVDFRGWADLWKIGFARWSPEDADWKVPPENCAIIEIQIDQARSEGFWTDLRP
jgi:2-succinyl-5-enolpyruvyl-6-hydroxy-3-cyclohexene-1-carboxylate synthase